MQIYYNTQGNSHPSIHSLTIKKNGLVQQLRKIIHVYIVVCLSKGACKRRIIVG